ncbi:MAG: hypothetical protein V7724_01330 [Sediminicola sp.]
MKNLKKILMGTSIPLFLISCAEPPKEVGTVKAPEKIIPVPEAKEMYDNYTERRVPLIQHYEDSINNYETKFDVARYAYYDYETIKNYLAFIEQEAKLANVEISTLRFYFSNYPDKTTFNDGKKILHPRQDSFFLQPTIKKGDMEYAFYTAEGEKGQRIPVLLTDQLEEASQFGSTNAASQKSYASMVPSSAYILKAEQSLILNEGSGVPPPYNR